MIVNFFRQIINIFQYQLISESKDTKKKKKKKKRRSPRRKRPTRDYFKDDDPRESCESIESSPERYKNDEKWNGYKLKRRGHRRLNLDKDSE